MAADFQLLIGGAWVDSGSGMEKGFDRTPHGKLFDVLAGGVDTGVAAINRDLFSFVVVRADDDLQFPVTVQIQRRNHFVSIGSVEAIFLSYLSFWFKITFNQLNFNFALDNATK